MEGRLTDKNFWVSDTGGEHVFTKHDQNHSIIQLIRDFIPCNNTGKCLEVGSFPGPFLAAFGDLGYTLNGIDFHPENSSALPEWLNNEGYKTGYFESADFFDVEPQPIFDVVCSFGFIEHFEDFEEVISRHIQYLKPRGILMITTPNFRGAVQNSLHRFFDLNNLDHHNVESMNPDLWAELALKNNMEVLYKGFFGGFWFWHGHEQLGVVKQKLLWFTERIIPRLRPIFPQNSKIFSAHCGLIARKR